MRACSVSKETEGCVCKRLAKAAGKRTQACVEQMRKVTPQQTEASLWKEPPGKAPVGKWVVTWSWKEHVPRKDHRISHRCSGSEAPAGVSEENSQALGLFKQNCFSFVFTLVLVQKSDQP